MNRNGWTLHEMLISLGVMGGVLALAAHLASGQLRFFRDAGELSALRGQIEQAGSIAATVLWAVSPRAGDISVAQDSAIEVHLPIGAAVVCASTAGRVTVPEPTFGNTLSSFSERPDAGDRMLALFDDSLGVTWLTFHVAEPSVSGGDCAATSGVSRARTVVLQEPVDVPAGTTLQFTRPVRLSLYRGSDSRWYLGAKDWNREFQRFNAVQPIAGPLRPYSADAATTGLMFIYRDTLGVQLEPPFETTRIASVTIISRATALRFADSSVVTVGLRNLR